MAKARKFQSAHVKKRRLGPGLQRYHAEKIRNAVTNKNNTFEEKTSSPVQTTRLCGRRIINISDFLDRMKSLGNHGPLGCSVNNMIFMREKRVGLKSCFIFKCNFCNIEESVWSEKDKERVMDVNTCAVRGTITTGGTHRRLEKMLSTMNIPPMSDKTFKKYEEAIAKGLTAIEEMKKVAEKEAHHAMENGEVDEEGAPHTNVVADGGRCKRSYKNNYSSVSGVGKSSQHCAASLRNNYSPDIQTPKTEIKEEIEVDEDQWKLQPQPIKEELTDDVEWVSDSSEQVKMEPKEEEEELEPVASVTIPSITEDLFEEEY